MSSSEGSPKTKRKAEGPKKRKAGRRSKDDKTLLKNLRIEVSNIKNVLEAKLLMAFPDPVGGKKFGAVELVTGSNLPDTILEYSRTDDEGITIAPGVSIRQRGSVGVDIDPENKKGESGKLTEMLKNNTKNVTPEFEGPVTMAGQSERLKVAKSRQFCVNPERSMVDVHTLPLELAIEQERRTVQHVVEVVDPTLDKNRSAIIQMQGELEAIKAQNAALIQVVTRLVAHSERSEALQDVLLAVTKLVPNKDIWDESEGEVMDGIDLPPAIDLVEYGDVLQVQPNVEIQMPEPLATISVAKQVQFQGSLDKKSQKDEAKKTKYWKYPMGSIPSKATRAARQGHTHEPAEPKASPVPIGSPAHQSEGAHLDGMNSEELVQKPRQLAAETDGSPGTPTPKSTKKQKVRDEDFVDLEPTTPTFAVKPPPLQMFTMSPSSRGNAYQGEMGSSGKDDLFGENFLDFSSSLSPFGDDPLELSPDFAFEW